MIAKMPQVLKSRYININNCKLILERKLLFISSVTPTIERYSKDWTRGNKRVEISCQFLTVLLMLSLYSCTEKVEIFDSRLIGSGRI